MTKIIFLHIPKTAGTSLRNLFVDRYPARELAFMYGEEKAFTDSAKNFPEAQITYGHLKYGVHEDMNAEARYYTILRRPVDRVVSFYNHMANYPQARYYEDIQRGLSLRDMVEGQLTPELSNHMTRIISGAKGQEPSTDAGLELAISNIETHFDFVGITERLDESLMKLAELLGWQVLPTMPELNVTPKRQGVSELSREEEDLILSVNQNDQKLYAYAVEQLEGQKKNKKHGVRVHINTIEQVSPGTYNVRGWIASKEPLSSIQLSVGEGVVEFDFTSRAKLTEKFPKHAFVKGIRGQVREVKETPQRIDVAYNLNGVPHHQFVTLEPVS